MKPDVLRTDGLQNYIVGSAESVWVVHSPGLGRWKQIRIARVLFVLGDQQIHRLLREGQCANGISRFRQADHQLSVDAVYLFCDGKRSIFNVQVRPKFSMHISN